MRGHSKVLPLAALALLSSARPEAAGKRIGVPKFEGAQEALVRKKVTNALKSHGFEVVGSRDIEDALKSAGATLDSDDGFKALAKELALGAIVTGEVGPKRAKIVVHDGGEGSILGDGSFNGANPAKLATEVGLTFWQKLGPDVGRGHVPAGAKKGQKAPGDAASEDEGGGGAGAAAAEAGGEAKPADESASADGDAASSSKKSRKPKMEEPPPEESAPSGPSGLPWFDLDLGGGGLTRSLTYNQVLDPNSPLLPYSLPLGPILSTNLLLYLEPLVGGPLGNLGWESHVQVGFGISSTLASGGTYSDTVHDFASGLRYRIPFAANQVYFSATGGEDAFTFAGGDRPDLKIPDTIYHYVRPGVGMRLASGALSLGLGIGYRYIFNSAGTQISNPQSGFFPHLTVSGADADLVVGYALSNNFELRAGVIWRRYWYAMHSEKNDTYIVGGAVDQSFAFTVRIALLIGGTSTPGSGGGDAEAPPPPKPKGSGRHPKMEDDDSGGGDSGGGDSGGDSGASDSGGGHKSGGDSDE